MFVLYAFLVTIGILFIDLIYTKTFQLENYKLKNQIIKTKNLDFAFGNKTPLIFTMRIKRLLFIDFLIKFVIFLLIFGLIPLFWVNLLLTVLLFIISPYYVFLSFIFASPIENFIKKRYIKRAKRKLESMSCKKIAITGSFGKTSTKNILYQILKVEFDVCATPKSFNTPMGICKTILEDLKDTDDFFIVEFGARQTGDIKFLADMVGVDFGIITPIGNCHLQTFGSLKNIENTKYELCENTKELVVFNGKSKSTKKLYDKFKNKKYLVCENGSFAYAKDIVSNENGSKFTLVLNNSEFCCCTKLLGKSNIDNIVVASTMAYLLGENILSIIKGISNLHQIAHRLELIKGEFVTVIDDSYNSNIEGFKQALDVLSGFKGRKIVVSPGIIELGAEQFKINFLAGEMVGKVADVFIIMNETNKKALSEGASKVKDIYFANSREEQSHILKDILKQGDIVLFENDFPDNIK